MTMFSASPPFAQQDSLWRDWTRVGPINFGVEATVDGFVPVWLFVTIAEGPTAFDHHTPHKLLPSSKEHAGVAAGAEAQMRMCAFVLHRVLYHVWLGVWKRMGIGEEELMRHCQ